MASHILGRRLNNTTKALSAWNRNHFGLAYRRIREIEHWLKTSFFNGERGRLTQRSLEDDLRDQRRHLELTYAQKSCELWLNEGDRNSRFFHTSNTMQRRMNFVGTILDGNSWLKTPFKFTAISWKILSFCILPATPLLRVLTLVTQSFLS